MDDMSRTRTNGVTVVVAVLVSAVLLSGCDWIMYRSNAALTGQSVGETAIGVGNVARRSAKRGRRGRPTM